MAIAAACEMSVVTLAIRCAGDIVVDDDIGEAVVFIALSGLWPDISFLFRCFVLCLRSARIDLFVC